MRRAIGSCVLVMVLVGLSMLHGCAEPAADVAKGGDWPMWRYGAGRVAATPHSLPDDLHLRWVRHYAPQKPTWDDDLNQDLMQFGNVREPVVMNGVVYLASSLNDRVDALDARTGKPRWTFYTNGPVRLPPVAVDGRVYVVADDGYLYCLDGATGDLNWKFLGAPSERRIIGNERLISSWPARGGPVLADNVVYFAAGIWPFMGVFIYAVDAVTGEEIWRSDSVGSKHMIQPHGAPSFAGVAPQGALVVQGDRLLVPGGRSVPAAFNRHTGELEYYHISKYPGGAFTCALGDFFVNYHRDLSTTLFSLDTGNFVLTSFGNVPVMTEDALYCMGDVVKAFDYANLRLETRQEEVIDKDTREPKTITHSEWKLDPLWEVEVDATGDLIKAGGRLYAGGGGVVSAVNIPPAGSQPAGEPKVSWTAEIEGTVERLVAGGNMLFVTTLEGDLYAFGEGQGAPLVYGSRAVMEPAVAQTERAEAKAVLKASGVDGGYALYYGARDAKLPEALAVAADLRLSVVEPNAVKARNMRRNWDEAGLYGSRLSVQLADPTDARTPAYMSSLTVVDKAAAPYVLDEGFLRGVFESLRPYGGTALFRASSVPARDIAQAIETLNLANAKVQRSGGDVLLVREGALPGSADWTHQYGDIAQTIKSDDQLVKLPLGVLWFGGSSHNDVLPRHGHGPPEQVIGGRMFIEGMGVISARDVYTGRVLWKRELAGLGEGVYWDDTYNTDPLTLKYGQVHIPGANARGANYVATEDKVYIAFGRECLVLDAATGDQVTAFTLPHRPGESEAPEWGYIGVHEDLLIAGSDFVKYGALTGGDPEDDEDKRSRWHDYDTTSSRGLAVMDRHTGAVLWEYESSLGLRHTGIVVGAGKLFCVNQQPPRVRKLLADQGITTPGTPAVLAFDVRTGEPIWDVNEGVFGTWLSYSTEHDILLQAGRPSRDMLRDEPNDRIAAYRGATGDVIWDKPISYGEPAIIHRDTIIAGTGAHSLLTGDLKNRVDPLTGIETPWTYHRNYGCNYAIASENLLTFRSGAAGFFDFGLDGGTGNFGGFKTGCTSNLVVANGVLNAPEYTRTCRCSYQNQTSLALVYAPEVEVWTDYGDKGPTGVVQSVGINLGAPGDRRAENGTLWLEYPKIAGPSPEIDIAVTPEDTTLRFTYHSSRIQSGEGLAWVAASGLNGVATITIDLGATVEGDGASDERAYSVNLHFSEPDGLKPGQRTFDVYLQGALVREALDIAAEAGGAYRPLVVRFGAIPVTRELEIRLSPSDGMAGHLPVISGIEAIVESPPVAVAR
jgi:outer membrane protein assembly factor BamB